MPLPILLEVCVETVASAVAAERGGARRIELCANLAVEGVTPDAALIESVRRHVTIPLHLLIRPRAGDFSYSATEFQTMKNQIRRAQQFRVNGLVFGILDSKARVDVARTRELVELAQPLSVTFHRAFDACADLPVALEEVVRTGANRVLTSGGARSAEEGSPMLAQLVTSAAGRIGILACGGIREGNVRKIVEATGVREVHTSLLDRGGRGERGGHDLPAETVVRFVEAAGKCYFAP